LGDLESARDTLLEALSLAKLGNNKLEIAAAMSSLEHLHRMEGDLDAADAMSCQVLAIVRGLDDRHTIGAALANSAMVAVLRGDGERAREFLLELLAISEELGGTALRRSFVEAAAGLAALQGDGAMSALLLGAARSQAERSGVRSEPADGAFLGEVETNARASISPAQFDAMARQGASMDLDRTVTDAADWLRSLKSHR
jgi:hypothetical protein